MSHTPGPWVAEIYPSLKEAKEAGLFSWVPGKGVFYGPVGAVHQGTLESFTGLPGSIETSRDNALLIAAAPDLLEALKLLTEFSMSGSKGNGETYIGWQRGDGPDSDERVAIARAAIAKAEGK